MVHEQSPPTAGNVASLFAGGEPPEGLDLVIANLGCPWSEVRGYRLGYQQVWPPVTLPLTVPVAALLGGHAFTVASAEAAPSSENLERKSRGRRRRVRKQGGRGVPNDVDYWLTKFEQDVGNDLKAEGCQRNEVLELMRERVYALSAQPLAQAINERYGPRTISATSIRRRRPSSEHVDSTGDTVKVLGSYISKRYAEWEPFRGTRGPDKQLVAGSTDPVVEDDREDNRARSQMDGGLKTATVQDAAGEEVVRGNLVVHEGGGGVLHIPEPVDDIEWGEDQEEQAATEYLREAGFNPSDVPWQPLKRDSIKPPN